MATTIRDLTAEDLGQDATEQDVREFAGWARQLMAADDSLTESDAIATLWNDGDYLTAAQRLGLTAN